MRLFNTLSRSIEEFVPLHPPKVGLYACGITAYDYAHIGHARKYTNDDVLRRTLTFLGFDVTHVQNVTDVGHLVSDADEGEDKLEKGARKSGKTVWDVARLFANDFYDSMDKLNILRPTVICRATDHIAEQIALIQKLFERGHAYDTQEAVYFDVTTFDRYGALSGQRLDEKLVAVRVEVEKGSHKKHPADFALWFKRVGRFAEHSMHWDSPWGDGFPGWHIECSAMSMKYLGETIDIHTGGEDHISVHHPNEIAQSESATGKQFVRFWVHHAFLMVEGEKMSKSKGNFYRLADVVQKGIDPLALRYLFLTTHHRKLLNFTRESLKAAQEGLKNLRELCQASQGPTLREPRSDLNTTSNRTVLSEEKLQKIHDFSNRFQAAVENDLQMPEALAIAWEVAKSNIPSSDKRELIELFDQILGLNLLQGQALRPQGLALSDERIPDDIRQLVLEREAKRAAKDWTGADALRQSLVEKGWIIEDCQEGPTLHRSMKHVP